jgi:hypothetical protein
LHSIPATGGKKAVKSSRRAPVPGRGTLRLFFFGHHQSMQPGPAHAHNTLPRSQHQRSYVGLYGVGKSKLGCFRGCRRKDAMPTDTLTVPSTKTWEVGSLSKPGRFAAGGSSGQSAVPHPTHPHVLEPTEVPPCKAFEIRSDSWNW